ncbi:helix-turn-helix domain-containing protein [Kitasatospora sp. NPDC004289]
MGVDEPARPDRHAPLTEAEQALILELHAEGVSRNDINRQTKIGAGTISRVVADAGGTFERAPEVIAATRAIQIDHKIRRQAIVDRLYRRSEAVLDRLESDTYTYHLSGPEGPEEVEAPNPPAQDERNLANSISSYLASAAKLEAVDAGDGASEARSVLGALAEGIRRVVEEADAGED